MMKAYLPRASGHGRCAGCGEMIKRNGRQIAIASPNASARMHTWCIVKLVIKSLLGYTTLDNPAKKYRYGGPR